MASSLEQFSEGMAAVVAQASESVVRVEGRRRLAATGVIFRDGVVVTADHVLRRDEDISIGLPNGERVNASLVGRDPSTDLAVLRAETGGTAAQWAGVEGLQVGHVVLALGRPDAKVMATLGIVSALDDAWQTRGGTRIDSYLQTDVVMYPGFSGGPLVDASGRVRGINTSGLMRGVSLSIPSATVERVVNALMEHGQITRGYLGVGTQLVRLPAQDNLQQETGLLVVSVEPDSPAHQGGLLLGDTLLRLDGQSITHIEALFGLLGGERVGTTVPIEVLRGGELKTLNVTIGARPDTPPREGREGRGSGRHGGWGRRGGRRGGN